MVDDQLPDNRLKEWAENLLWTLLSPNMSIETILQGMQRLAPEIQEALFVPIKGYPKPPLTPIRNRCHNLPFRLYSIGTWDAFLGLLLLDLEWTLILDDVRATVPKLCSLALFPRIVRTEPVLASCWTDLAGCLWETYWKCPFVEWVMLKGFETYLRTKIEDCAEPDYAIEQFKDRPLMWARTYTQAVVDFEKHPVNRDPYLAY